MKVLTLTTMTALLLMLGEAVAFSPDARTRRKMVKSALKAWTLPSPQSFDTKTLFGPSWYTEGNDPTWRRAVYNDVPVEFTFSSPGYDWPSSYSTEEEMENDGSNKKQGRQLLKPLRPLRRAAKKWALVRRRRRKLMDRS